MSNQGTVFLKLIKIFKNKIKQCYVTLAKKKKLALRNCQSLGLNLAFKKYKSGKLLF